MECEVDAGVAYVAFEVILVGGGLRQVGPLGVLPSDIDTVVVSHAHGDHIGGATLHGVPTYPEALYWLSETEWNHWLEPSAMPQWPWPK